MKKEIKFNVMKKKRSNVQSCNRSRTWLTEDKYQMTSPEQTQDDAVWTRGLAHSGFHQTNTKKPSNDELDKTILIQGPFTHMSWNFWPHSHCWSQLWDLKSCSCSEYAWTSIVPWHLKKTMCYGWKLRTKCRPWVDLAIVNLLFTGSSFGLQRLYIKEGCL